MGRRLVAMFRDTPASCPHHLTPGSPYCLKELHKVVFPGGSSWFTGHRKLYPDIKRILEKARDRLRLTSLHQAILKIWQGKEDTVNKQTISGCWEQEVDARSKKWILEAGSGCWVQEVDPDVEGWGGVHHRRAGGASNGDKKENARDRASFHTDQHDQPCVNIQQSRTMERGWRAASASNEGKRENARDRASFHTEQHD